MNKTHTPAFPAVNELIIKLASRCNINCTYCYWFEDPLVMQAPKMLQPDVQDALVKGLQRHIQDYGLKEIRITFHGGEPTLFPKHRFESLCESLRLTEQNTDCRIDLSMQTNGLLVDETWIRLLTTLNVILGVSLDGDKQLHDSQRLDHQGRGTYLKTIDAIERIKASGLAVYILSVAAPKTEPSELLNHFVDHLGLKDFDLLIPHANHESRQPSIAQYYCDLFDSYITSSIEQGVNIRILDGYMHQIIAAKSNDERPGYITTVTLLTDGKLEATDDLRTVPGLRPSDINIKTHDLQQVTDDPLWQEVCHASINLAKECETCELKNICAGGPMVTRWTDENRFNNPSVYCQDFKLLIPHIQRHLQPHLDKLKEKREASPC